MIRTVALQANEELDDNSAAHIVNFMASLAVGMPCPECREHFVEDWIEDPYTIGHAKSNHASMHWVEELRRKVDLRVAAKRRELGLDGGAVGSASASASARASAGAGAGAGAHALVLPATDAAPAIRPLFVTPTPVPSVSGTLSRIAARRRGKGVLALGGSGGSPGLSSATSSSSASSAALRQYAITSAMHVTRANQSGRRMGCNCAVHKPGTGAAVRR